jgi:two-component system phosphate regulon sensor histidine kinase PhoR
MLSFAGIQSGRQLYDLRPVDAGEIVKHALSAFAPSLAEQDWQVETDIACDLPPAIADAQALESAVKNLIQNAMKYASEGKSLGIRVEADQAAKQIKITVADCGEGIDPTDLPHIFQPFYRGKKVLASPIGGAGLGLSLVDRHLRAMRGRVTVTTSPQTGTAFTLHLPAQNKIE